MEVIRAAGRGDRKVMLGLSWLWRGLSGLGNTGGSKAGNTLPGKGLVYLWT